MGQPSAGNSALLQDEFIVLQSHTGEIVEKEAVEIYPSAEVGGPCLTIAG
jgi:hypothetical protein